MGGGVIAAIVILPILLLLAICLCAGCAYRRHRREVRAEEGMLQPWVGPTGGFTAASPEGTPSKHVEL